MTVNAYKDDAEKLLNLVGEGKTLQQCPTA